MHWRIARIGRIEIRDDVFCSRFIEIERALIGFGAISTLYLDQERISSPQHVSHDAGSANAFCGVVLIEGQLCIACPDIENADFSSHFEVPFRTPRRPTTRLGSSTSVLNISLPSW